jgi:hypothetical protein
LGHNKKFSHISLCFFVRVFVGDFSSYGRSSIHQSNPDPQSSDVLKPGPFFAGEIPIDAGEHDEIF